MSFPALLRSAMDSNESSLPPEHIIFGQSQAMRVVQQKVEMVARTDVPVLLRGDSGTGKEVLARLIHRRSPWAAAPFVKVNCPAVPAAVLETQLFGYERGPFPGAFEARTRQADRANRGTLLLDEIGELEPALQAKLVQFFQGGQIGRANAERDAPLPFRIVCATKCDLEHGVRTGAFRLDLFYCINVVSIFLPLLRERVEDIPALANYFLACYREKYHSQAYPLPPRLIQILQQYDWPGNIRELENLINRYVILESEEAIVSELTSRSPIRLVPDPSYAASVSPKKPAARAVDNRERQAILKLLRANHGNRKQAARVVNISYRALLHKLKEVGVPPKRVRPVESSPVAHPVGTGPGESADGNGSSR